MRQHIPIHPGASARAERANAEKFSFKQLTGAFASLPRVMSLVWSTSALFTTLLGILSLLQGFSPALSVWITGLVIDSVVAGIRLHSPNPIWFPIGLQLAILLISNLLSTLSNIVQQLLQEKVSNRVQLLILEKSNTLDLAFFENPEFYDKMRQAADQSSYQPVSMISQTFDLFRTACNFPGGWQLWRCWCPFRPSPPAFIMAGGGFSGNAGSHRNAASWIISIA